jgi:hypothetical protein
MSDLSDTIKGFYSEFILRDLLSFVTPGAIVVGTFFFALSELGNGTIFGNSDFLFRVNHISIVFWILLFGLFYIIGLGMQNVSQRISLCTMKNFNHIDLIFPPKEYINKFRDNSGCAKEANCDKLNVPDKKNEREIEFGFDEKLRNAKYYHCMRLPFLSHSNNVERKTHERFIVLMQSSGNCAVAFFLSSLMSVVFFILLLMNGSFNYPLIFWMIFCLFFSVCLYSEFNVLRQRVFDWEYEVINYYR